MTDTIDEFAGITPGTPLDAIRARRPEARLNAQRGHDFLFDPEDARGVSRPERLALAMFVAGLHRDDAALNHYRRLLETLADGKSMAEAIESVTEDGKAVGPFGAYPKGPLEVESTDGVTLILSTEQRKRLGGRLSAAVEHSHMLVFHPRESGPEHLDRLSRAGWSPDDIVTLSQIVSFLSFQIRTAAGLRVLSRLEGAQTAQGKMA